MAPGMPDSDAFTDHVLDRLIADDHGDEPWADLVLAACAGTEVLTAALDGHGTPRPTREGSGKKDAAPPEPPGAYLRSITVAYLRSITVEGFRGIGPAATLTLTPGPGLTLVVGRNGSGKSSFAGASRCCSLAATSGGMGVLPSGRMAGDASITRTHASSAQSSPSKRTVTVERGGTREPRSMRVPRHSSRKAARASRTSSSPGTPPFAPIVRCCRIRSSARSSTGRPNSRRAGGGTRAW
jgi:hypothetical protein